ncbi:MAG TPA: penicillin acylase family protein [bacterium]|nr:penicillin acylase family protein [bacterium]
MPRSLRYLFLFLAGGGLIFFLLMLFGYRLVTRSLPTVAGVIHISGLDRPVSVYRDDTHIPHILAKTESDLFFAQGFVAAQNRFFQMDFNRRLAAGRLFELFGPASSKTDSLMQTVGIIRSVERLRSALDPETEFMFGAYTQGVNAFLNTHADRLPMEFKLMNDAPESWRIEDCLAVQALYVWLKDASWRMRPLLGAVAEKAGVAQARILFPGMNTDGLSPRTVKTIADTLIIKRLESVFGEGFIPPVPGDDLACVVRGRRMVSGYPVLATRPGFAPIQPALWYEVHLCGGGIDAAGFSLPGFPGILHGHNHRVAWTHVHRHGFSLSGWTVLPKTQYRILHAGDVRQAAGAVGKYPESSIRFLFADTSGNIWPTPQGSWDWSIISSERSGTYAERTLDRLLGQRERLSAQDLQTLSGNRFSAFAGDVREAIHRVFGAVSDRDSAAGAALRKLLSWDLSYRPGSSEAVLFAAFIENCFSELWGGLLGETLLTAYARLGDIPLRALDDALGDTVNSESVGTAWLEAVEKLRRRLGPDMDAWSWGAYRRLIFHHPIRFHPLLTRVYQLGPFVAGGSGETVEGPGHAWNRADRITACPSGRLIIDMATRLGVSVLPTGQGGQPLDPHYGDQIQRFLSIRFHPNLTDTSRILHSGWEHLTLISEDDHVKKRRNPRYPAI